MKDEKSVQSSSFLGSLTAQKEAGDFWLTLDLINQLYSENTKENVNLQAHREKYGKMRTKKINQWSRKKAAKKKHGKPKTQNKKYKCVQLHQITVSSQ